MRYFYPGGGTLGCVEVSALWGFQLVEQEAAQLGLHFNHKQIRADLQDPPDDQLLHVTPDFCTVNPGDPIPPLPHDYLLSQTSYHWSYGHQSIH